MRKSSFETSGFNPLASELSQWAAERRAERSERTQKQAFKEGLKEGAAAKSIERKKPLFGFIGKDSAEAHNRGLEAAYIAGVDSDNLARINEIGLKNQGDVAKYDAEIEGMFSGLQKELDPQLAPELILSARKAADRQRLRIQEQAYNKQQNEIKAGLSKSRTTYYDDAARQARNGDIEGSAESLIKYEATLSQQLEQGYINQAEYQELLRDAEREATEHTHFGKIDRMSTAEAAKWLDENKQVPKGFTADEWDVFTSKVSSDVSRRQSKERISKEAVIRENKLKLDEYINRSSMGFAVNDNENAIVRSIDPKTYAYGKELSAFALLPYEAQKNIIDNLSVIESSDPEKAIATRKVYSNVRRMAESNPYELAVKQGVVEHKPINFGDPQSFIDRNAVTQEAAEHYGVNAKLMTDAEVSQYSKILDEATVPEKMQMLAVINDSGVKSVYEQLFDKGYGVAAIAAASEDVKLMESILTGQEKLKLNLVKKPKVDEYLNEFNETVKDVYQGDNKKALLETVLAHYANKGNDVFSLSEFNDSIEEVAGKFDMVKGSYVQLPKGVSDDALERYFEKITPEQASSLDSTFTPDITAKIINNGTPISAGSDEYYIEYGGLTLLGNDGKPLRVPYNSGWVAPKPRIGRKK